jgi:hypothetical protein
MSINNTVSHLITYSDTSGAQNRNHNTTVMMTVAVESHPSLEIIDQKFLLPGHTHLEFDVDHAQIERPKIHNPFEIMSPKDWYNFVSSVRGKVPMKVTEMGERFFFSSYSHLLTDKLVKHTKDTDGNPIK